MDIFGPAISLLWRQISCKEQKHGAWLIKEILGRDIACDLILGYNNFYRLCIYLHHIYEYLVFNDFIIVDVEEIA